MFTKWWKNETFIKNGFWTPCSVCFWECYFLFSLISSGSPASPFIKRSLLLGRWVPNRDSSLSIEKFRKDPMHNAPKNKLIIIKKKQHIHSFIMVPLSLYYPVWLLNYSLPSIQLVLPWEPSCQSSVKACRVVLGCWSPHQFIWSVRRKGYIGVWGCACLHPVDTVYQDVQACRLGRIDAFHRVLGKHWFFLIFFFFMPNSL